MPYYGLCPILIRKIKEEPKMAFGAGVPGCGTGGFGTGIAIVVVIILLLIALGIVF